MRPTIAYQPALDGVRALAVAAVLLFHGGVAGFAGGYLGVSVFFTLSGYLITSLLIAEHDGTGRVDLAAFYTRRLRRLLPASALCLVTLIVLSRVTDWFDRAESLRTHVVGAALQVANWVFLAGGGSYQDLLAEHAGTASPLEHFWSLSIEEQFYWVWPPAMALLFARVAARRRRTAVVAVVTVLALLAAPVTAQVWGPDAAYWATPARIGEILVGAVLAFVLVDHRPVDRRWGAAGVAGLAALGVGVATFPSSGGPAFNGALPLVALASGALLVGLQVDGPLRRLLSAAPLVGLGRISYGVYLYHWPVYVVLDEPRTGIGGAALLALRLGVTLVISVASFVWFETPIRTGKGSRRVTFGVAALGTAAVAAVAAVAVPRGLGEYWRVDADTAQAAAIDEVDDSALVPVTVASTSPAPTTTPGSVAGPTPVTTVPGPLGTTPSTAAATTPPTSAVPVSSTLPPVPGLARPVRIVVTGDSTANALGAGVVGWAAAHPDRAQVEVAGGAGCGFVTGGDRRYADEMRPDTCAGWTDELVLPVVERTRPDVVVVMASVWDVIDRRWDDGAPRSPLDPEYRAHLDVAYTDLVDRLIAAGAGRVAFVRQPVPDVWWQEQVHNEDEPERHHVLYEVFDTLERIRPGAVAVIPFADWFAEQGYADDRGIRPDGIHLAPEAATDLVTRYLGDQFVRAALGVPTRPGGPL